MSKPTNALRAAQFVAPVLLAVGMAAPLMASADMMEHFWSAAEPQTAWVTNYGECWQSKDGPTDLQPCVTVVVPEEFTVRLNFEFDKYQLQNVVNDNELRRLDGYIADVKATPANEYLTVVGHTDAKGSYEYNDALGQRRANTVRDYIISQGVPASQVAPAESLGERDMLPEYSPYALEQRRVVIKSDG
ncbi:outer membrane protein/peptidoglycan-associated (lipo)protein [Thioflavicoccus mobilis 8321]|uniref:Outer membrane protein/peptidoglycan-associated (Lipo)protein n=1 Tax=Thioflavicoccus mobilis 8321 TaxID=765912 RepID=L0GZV4_9GAMM|nr:OmpA family protein [Thioflavicoccus mobilis]AGA90910.1 outer membrane protein/peptidoglycan-associated (lipo)protein [Thioflavicoccus mobilis 8321]